MTELRLTQCWKRREKENAFVSTVGLNLKVPCPVEIIAKPHHRGYVVSQFWSLRKKRKHSWTRGTFSRLCGNVLERSQLMPVGIFQLLHSPSYTWNVLKIKSVHNWEQLVSAFNRKFFYPKEKSPLVELGELPSTQEKVHNRRVGRIS